MKLIDLRYEFETFASNICLLIISPIHVNDLQLTNKSIEVDNTLDLERKHESSI